MLSSEKFGAQAPFSIWNRHRAAAFFGIFCPIPKSCTDLDRTLLYILILGTCSRFARKNKMLLLGVCFPHTCTSAGHMFAAWRPRLHYYQPILSFHNNEFDEMPHQLNLTENPRSLEKYPTLHELLWIHDRWLFASSKDASSHTATPWHSLLKLQHTHILRRCVFSARR